MVECDSKEFHESWEQQVKDRNRDLALAALGYATLRLTAAQIMYRPDEVLAALAGSSSRTELLGRLTTVTGLVLGRRACHNSA